MTAVITLALALSCILSACGTNAAGSCVQPDWWAQPNLSGYQGTIPLGNCDGTLGPYHRPVTFPTGTVVGIFSHPLVPAVALSSQGRALQHTHGVKIAPYNDGRLRAEFVLARRGSGWITARADRERLLRLVST